MICVLAALFVDLLDAELPNHLKFRTACRRDGIGNRNHAAEVRLVDFGNVMLNHERIADRLDVDGHRTPAVARGASSSDMCSGAPLIFSVGKMEQPIGKVHL